jgi:hypothetical protein
MVDWPTTLPDLQLLGLTEQRQEARLRSQMDAGPPKMRRRFTAAVVQYQIPVIFTGAQKQTFDAFYKTTLLEGSLPFVWDDPVTDAAVSFTFREAPTFRLDLGGLPNNRIWTATLALERLP